MKKEPKSIFKSIPYRPELRELCGGSIAATLLFQQIVYQDSQKQGKFLYKFKAPCSHKDYREGDSWCEELKFSVKEFTTALNKIGDKNSKKQHQAKDALVWYWVTMERKTFYELNISFIEKQLKKIYSPFESEPPKEGYIRKYLLGIYQVTKGHLPSDQRAFMESNKGHLLSDQREVSKMHKGHLDNPITETTTETTTEITSKNEEKYKKEILNLENSTNALKAQTQTAEKESGSITATNDLVTVTKSVVEQTLDSLLEKICVFTDDYEFLKEGTLEQKIIAAEKDLEYFERRAAYKNPEVAMVVDDDSFLMEGDLAKADVGWLSKKVNALALQEVQISVDDFRQEVEIFLAENEGDITPYPDSRKFRQHIYRSIKTKLNGQNFRQGFKGDDAGRKSTDGQGEYRTPYSEGGRGREVEYFDPFE